MDGVLVADKPQGLTSHDVVARARRLVHTRRVGHIGTLDPMATGVLPLVVGRATRLASLLSVGPKVYDATIRLGVATDTYDITGAVVAPVSPPPGRVVTVDRKAVEQALESFSGDLLQRPPPFSAKKVSGVRAYRLARQNRPVTMTPVTVTVHDIEVIDVTGDRLRCRVACSAGFYMRSLAHDLGEMLGCGACLESLRRERSGPFGLDQAVTLDALEAHESTAGDTLIPLPALLPELPRVVVTERGARLAAHGNVLTAAEVREPGDPEGGPADRPAKSHEPHRLGKVKVYDGHGVLLAIAERGPGSILHPRIVLV